MPPNEGLLLLPAGSALLYVIAAFLLKRGIGAGAGQAQVNLYVNVGAGVLFLPLLTLAGECDWTAIWMPLVAGATFFAAQIFTFEALRHGDVSVATPLLGMKVLFITVVSAIGFGEILEARWWLGALASSIGVVLVTGATWRTLAPRLLKRDAVMSLAAAATFAVTDVLVQKWAPRFGITGFIPVMFGFVAVVTAVVFVPQRGLQIFRVPRGARLVLTLGTIALSVQALGMALALGYYGNATAVNIVYSSRAIWSVVLGWALGRYFASPEPGAAPGVMPRRLAGSILLFAAVVLVLI
ncbi:MAG: DMT family transporter [Chthoniobacterales bacterium]